jgi:hypothetical protein
MVLTPALGRGGDDLVATLRRIAMVFDPTGAADDDDLYGLPSLVDDWRPLKGFDSK